MKKTKFVRTSLATVITVTLMAWSAHASLIWDGNATNGLGVFKTIDIEDTAGDSEPNPSPNGSSVTTFTDATYGASWQFLKAVNDHRCEAHGAKGVDPAIGSTYYLGWRCELTSTVTDNAVFQWKAYDGTLQQNFPLVIKCVNGALQFHYYSSNVVDHLIWSQNVLPVNFWNTLVVKIVVSDQPADGSVSFWFNGVAQTFTNGSTTYACRTFDGDSVDPKWGVYGADATQVINSVNALKIGTTYADVAPTAFGGAWEIQNVTSSKVLNQGGSLTNGSPISQWTEGSSENLKFTFIPTSNGYYQINSVKSGLDVAVQNAATTNGAPLVQWSYGSTGDDQWEPLQNSDGTWTFYNLHSGDVLNNPGSTANGTQYSQWSWANSNNEKFNLIQE
jgi:hypothetical protein